MVCKQCQTNQLGGQSLAQPPSPPSEEPKDHHPIEQTLQKRCRGTWQSSQASPKTASQLLFIYFLSININCLSFTWISMGFVTCISGKKCSKSCNPHLQNIKSLNSAKLFCFFKHLLRYPGRQPGGLHPPSLSNFGFGSFGPWGKGSWARKQNLRGGLKGYGISESKWKKLDHKSDV